MAIRRSQTTNIRFRVTKRLTRFHSTRERIPHLIWHHHIKRDQSLSDLFQGTHSLEPLIKLKKIFDRHLYWNLKVCFSRQVNVVPPQAAAARVTALYVAVHLNLTTVVSVVNDNGLSRRRPGKPASCDTSFGSKSRQVKRKWVLSRFKHAMFGPQRLEFWEGVRQMFSWIFWLEDKEGPKRTGIS